jgi:MOSC domain-containing protein
MTTEENRRVTALYRYPVKGMSAQALSKVHLKAGETMPLDRAWAIENGPGRFDPLAPKHLPKVAFLMLMRNERLASLSAEFDEATTTLTLRRDGRQVARGNLATRIGCQLIEQFIAAFMKDSLRGPPKIVSAEGHSFSDVAAKCLHIANLASVRELERVSARDVDPLRFRPNLLFEGTEPWEEFDWIGRTIRIGTMRLEVFSCTVRCDATNVDPTTASRDMAIPAILERNWGHTHFGVYARVIEGGEIAIGNGVVVD